MLPHVESNAIVEIEAEMVELSADLGHDRAWEVLDLFLEDGLPRLQHLTRAVLSSERCVAQREAHSLKGGLGCVGATSLSKLCAALERKIGIGDWAWARTDLFELRMRLNEVRNHFGSGRSSGASPAPSLGPAYPGANEAPNPVRSGSRHMLIREA